MKKLISVLVVLCLAAGLCACGGTAPAEATPTETAPQPTEPPAPTETAPQPTDPPAPREITEFMTFTGLDKMAEALDAGAEVESAYYTDGYGFSTSEFTTTDAKEIEALWDALCGIELGGPTDESITDWYPLIVFTLNDGSRYGARFESNWLTMGPYNYELENDGAFWRLTGELVKKYREE